MIILQCKKTVRTVVCTGGFHMDDLDENGIREVLEAIEEIETGIEENIDME